MLKNLEFHEFISGITNLLEIKDSYTRGHSDRVATYARLIAERMHLSSEEVEIIHIAGNVHDIGKVGVCDNILNKPGRLTKEEYDMVKKHSVLAYDVLSKIKDQTELALMVRGHHERWDGGGYPDNLKEHEILLGSRILAVADVYDAITSHRIYRNRLTYAEALEELRRNKWTQFDGNIVDNLCAIIEDEQEDLALYSA